MSVTSINSGITYSIDGKGLQFPDKITTVNSSLYPLLDAHFVDWNNSILSQLTYINPNLIERFAYKNGVNPSKTNFDILGADSVSGRQRYEADTYFANVGLNNGEFTPPHWYTNGSHAGSITNTAELLDIIDFLTFTSTYCFNLIENLYVKDGQTNPIIKFVDSQIRNYGGKVNQKTFNVDVEDRIIFNIFPNQTNPDFSNLFPHIMENRQISLDIHGYDVYNMPISNIDFYLANPDNPDVHTASLKYFDSETVEGGHTPFAEVKIDTNISASTDIDVMGGAFKVDLLTNGWAPELLNPSDHYGGWDDTRHTMITFWTPVKGVLTSTNRYAQSNDLELNVEIKKVKNDIEYVFINDVEYKYLPVGYFKGASLPSIDKFNEMNKTEEYENNAFLISIEDIEKISKTFDSLEVSDFDNEELFNSLVVCSFDSSITMEHFLKVKNNIENTVEIFPKYYGDSIFNETTGKATYCGSKDIKMAGLDKSLEVIYNIKAWKDKTDASDRDYAKEPKFTAVNLNHTRVINGIERNGFKLTIKINQTINSHILDDITGADPRRADLVFGTTPTNFIGGSLLKFRVITDNALEVKFTDISNVEVYNFNENLTPIDYYKGSKGIGLENSTLTNNNTVWNVKLPLFTERSFGSNNIRPDYLAVSGQLEGTTGIFSISTLFSYPDINAPIIYDCPILREVRSQMAEFLPSIPDANRAKSSLTSGFPYIKLWQKNIENKNLSNDKKQNFRDGEKCWPLIKATLKNTSIDVSDKIEIDYEKTYINNKDTFLKDCSNAFISKVESQSSNLAKGKILASRYCALVTEEESKRIKMCYLVFIRPTVPDKYIDSDYESIWTESNNSFKLYLKVPENKTANSSTSLYSEGTLIVNLMVTRSSRDLIGWAYQISSKTGMGAEIKEISLGERTSLRSLVSNTAFNGNNHTLQTRLSSYFIPIESKMEVDGELTAYNVISKRDNLTNTIVKYYYDLGPSKPNYSYIIFYGADKNDTASQKIFNYGKIDDYNNVRYFELEGNMNSDDKFIGFYGSSVREYYMRVVKNTISINHKLNFDDQPWVLFSPHITLSNNGNVNGMRAALVKYVNITSEDGDDSLIDSDYTINILDEFLEIPTPGSIGWTSWIKAYGDDVDTSKICQLSVTGLLSKRGYDSTGENSAFDNMMSGTDNLDNVGYFLTGTYNKETKAININRPTDSVYNKFYIGNSEQVNLDNYININGSQLKITKHLLDIIQGDAGYKCLKLRVGAIFPMTTEYRGFCYDVKLYLVFNGRN